MKFNLQIGVGATDEKRKQGEGKEIYEDNVFMMTYVWQQSWDLGTRTLGLISEGRTPSFRAFLNCIFCSEYYPSSVYLATDHGRVRNAK